MTAASKQNGSPSLLATLVSSLLSSFSPLDVVSDIGKTICATALLKVSSLSRRGYLVGVITAQSLAELVSAYTIKTKVGSVGNSTVKSPYDVAKAASWLVEGVQLGMASGEFAVSLVTSNFQVSILSELVSDSINKVLATPATASQLAYGSIQPKITLGPYGLISCGLTGGYAHMSVLQWSVNPYPGSLSVKSPLLRFSSAVQATTYSGQQYGFVSTRKHQTHAIFLLPVPAYYIALQFSSMQNFNFSAITGHSTATQRGLFNFTIPSCSLYNGAAYAACVGCSISSYTNYNVTYSCSDIKPLCPSISGRRRLTKEIYDSSGAIINHLHNDNGFERDGLEDNYGSYSRLLTDNDDASASPVSSLSYGVLIESIKAELTDVLSSNPFNLDLAHSTVVLTFMGCLCGFIVLVVIRLSKVDRDDKLHKIYVKKEADDAAIKFAEENLKDGGKDDLRSSFRLQLSQSVYSLASGSFINSFSDLRSRKKSASSTILGVSFDFNEERNDESDSDDGRNDDGDDSGGEDFGFDSIYSGDNSEPAARGVLKIKKRRSKSSLRTIDSEKMMDGEKQGLASVVKEFLYGVYPANSYFFRKNNAIAIICARHNYFTMFFTSTVAHSRTIRFIDLIALVLTSLFADTVFFGIFYPISSSCTSKIDKVRRLRPSATYQGDKFLPYYCMMGQQK